MATIIDGSSVNTTNISGALDAADLTGNVAAARIVDALNASGSAPLYACRAWVNFNGQSTVTIGGSGNVSSITDNGVGDYTVNFTTAMPDTNYAVTGSARWTQAAVEAGLFTMTLNDVKSTTQMRIRSGNSTNASGVDMSEVNAIFFR